MKALLALPKDKLQKVILVAILSLIGTGVVGYFFIGSRLTTLSTSRQLVAELKPKVTQAENGVKFEVQNGRVRDQMKAFLDNQEAKMITGDPFIWVVREISLLAEKNPIRVAGVRPGSTMTHAEKTRFQMFVTHIDLEGGYDQIGRFIRDLENSFPTGQVRSLQMSPLDPSRAACRASLQFAMLILPDDNSDRPATNSNQERKKTS